MIVALVLYVLFVFAYGVFIGWNHAILGRVSRQKITRVRLWFWLRRNRADRA